MKLLTPEEVLEAFRKDKPVEINLSKSLPWQAFDKFRMNVNVLINPETSFRLAQEMITIDDVAFPKPESEPPRKGVYYWVPVLTWDTLINSVQWYGGNVDLRYLKRGLVHLTEERAMEHAKALIKLSGGTYE